MIKKIKNTYHETRALINNNNNKCSAVWFPVLMYIFYYNGFKHFDFVDSIPISIPSNKNILYQVSNKSNNDCQWTIKSLRTILNTIATSVLPCSFGKLSRIIKLTNSYNCPQGFTHERTPRLQIPSTAKAQSPRQEGAQIWLRHRQSHGTGTKIGGPSSATSNATAIHASSYDG